VFIQGERGKAKINSVRSAQFSMILLLLCHVLLLCLGRFLFAISPSYYTHYQLSTPYRLNGLDCLIAHAVGMRVKRFRVTMNFIPNLKSCDLQIQFKTTFYFAYFRRYMFVCLIYNFNFFNEKIIDMAFDTFIPIQNIRILCDIQIF